MLRYVRTRSFLSGVFTALLQVAVLPFPCHQEGLSQLSGVGRGATLLTFPPAALRCERNGAAGVPDDTVGALQDPPPHLVTVRRG